MAPRKQKAVPTYPGPSRDVVDVLSDAKVLEELARLKIEPRKLYHMENDEMLVAAHGDKDFDHTWTKAELKELRQKVHAWHGRCLKDQLLSEYMAEWIATLSDGACWIIFEDFEERKVALSEKRYTSRDKLRSRTGWAVWAIECDKHSTKGGPNECN